MNVITQHPIQDMNEGIKCRYDETHWQQIQKEIYIDRKKL